MLVYAQELNATKAYYPKKMIMMSSLRHARFDEEVTKVGMDRITNNTISIKSKRFV